MHAIPANSADPGTQFFCCCAASHAAAIAQLQAEYCAESVLCHQLL